LQNEQAQRIKSAQEELDRLPEWVELTQQEQNALLGDLEALQIEASQDLAGLQALVNQEYTINSQVQDVKRRIQKIGSERVREKVKAEQDKAAAEGKPQPMKRQFASKAKITSMNDLDVLIGELNKLRAELYYAHEFELVLNLKDEG
jgi:septal ring factor EnvC (AmiA/AmiB activator)